MFGGSGDDELFQPALDPELEKEESLGAGGVSSKQRYLSDRSRGQTDLKRNRCAVQNRPR